MNNKLYSGDLISAYRAKFDYPVVGELVAKKEKFWCI